VLGALREIGVDFAQGNWISPPSPFPAKTPSATPSARAGTESARLPEVRSSVGEIAFNSIT